jgi:tetratricopeptide repeat protein
MRGDAEPTPATELGEASFIRLADAHRREGLVEDAIRICREGLAKFPSSLHGRILLGQSLLDHGAIGEAIVELGRVEREGRDNPEILALLCQVRMAGPQRRPPGVETVSTSRTSETAAGESAREAHGPSEPAVLILGFPAQAESPGEVSALPATDPLASPTLAGLYASQGDSATAEAILRQIPAEETLRAAPGPVAAEPSPVRYLDELRRLRAVAGRLRKIQPGS